MGRHPGTGPSPGDRRLEQPARSAKRWEWAIHGLASFLFYCLLVFDPPSYFVDSPVRFAWDPLPGIVLGGLVLSVTVPFMLRTVLSVHVSTAFLAILADVLLSPVRGLASIPPLLPIMLACSLTIGLALHGQRRVAHTVQRALQRRGRQPKSGSGSTP